MDYIHPLEKALLYIENNLENPITTAAVAAAASYSYYHFHRFFQTMTGTTIGNYIRARRLTKASRELLYTDKRILDIAVALQFESHAAFTRAFKNYYQTTPEEYRKNRVETILRVREEIGLAELHHLANHITLQPEMVDVADMQLIGIRYITNIYGNQNAEWWAYFNSHQYKIDGAFKDSPRYGIFEANEDCLNGSLNERSSATAFIGIQVAENASPPEGMCRKFFRGGKYARFTHRGGVDSLLQSYRYIWGAWIPTGGMDIDNRDDFECYTERFRGADNPGSEIDIYLPVKG